MNENNQSVCYLKPNSLEQLVFSLSDNNFDFTVAQTILLFDKNFRYTFNNCLIILVYSAFLTRRETIETYFNYLHTIQAKEDEINNNNKTTINEILINYISEFDTQETYYVIEKMIEKNLVDSNITKKFTTKYFAHYKTKLENKIKYKNDIIEDTFLKNYNELSKNDWELHKKLIVEGVNPNELAKIIRNDEIEKLQEVSSQENFDFNQKIEPSLYERCSFINKENVSLIDYAAFFSSVKCFKYLLMNGASVENTGKYAVAGGNEEIIHLCEQNHSTFEDAYETAIEFHRNDIFKYLFENKIEKLDKNQQATTYVNTKQIPFQKFGYYVNNTQTLYEVKLQELIYYCINKGNYEIFSLLEKEIQFDEYIINVSAKIGNLYLVEYFLQNYEIPKKILLYATESGNIELVQFVLQQKGIDINERDDYYNVFEFVIIL